MSLGLLALLLETGKPFRALILFKSFVNFSSWMTIGAWLLFSALVIYALYALFRTDRVVARLRRLWKPLEEKSSVLCTILAAIGIPLSLGVAVYTGILLGVLPFIPFWHTWLLPLLFTASALDTGVALVAANAILREKGNGVTRLRTVFEASIVALVAIEAIILWFYLQTMLTGSPDMANSAQILTSGALSLPFWIIVVSLGLAVPFLVGLIQLSRLVKRATVVLPLVGIAPALLGGFILRFVILSAGLHASLSSPGLQQILDGITFIP
jgi:formate-dependent nitrite reductase membrane component NrfD